MSSKTEHVFTPEHECLEGLAWAVKESEMLCDIQSVAQRVLRCHVHGRRRVAEYFIQQRSKFQRHRA